MQVVCIETWLCKRSIVSSNYGVNECPRIFFDQECCEVATVEQRGMHAAFALAEAGVGDGDVVAVLLRNEPAFVEALTCIRCLNAVRVLVPWHLELPEVLEIITAVRPALLIGHADLMAPLVGRLPSGAKLRLAVVDVPDVISKAYELGSLPVGFPPGWLRWSMLVESAGIRPLPPVPPRHISLSSGSTGTPKVMRWQGTPRWQRQRRSDLDEAPPIETTIISAPMFHGAQYGLFMHAWFSRANHVILAKFDAEIFLAAVEAHCATHAYAVPTMFNRLLRLPEDVRRQYDLSSLNHIMHTGAICPCDVKRAMIEWLGPVIWEVYGCSEVSTISVCSSAAWLRKPGTVGRPIHQVAILDEGDNPCAVGQRGRIFVDVTGQPRLTFNGVSAPTVVVDGLEMIAAGDIGWLDEEGDLFVAGRVDDLINTGRLKVYPLEIENEILAHPQVLDCAVFALPDDEFGQAVGAVVEVAPAWTGIERDIREFLMGRISEHKIPARIWVQSSTFRSASGKFNRGGLARRCAATEAAGAL